MTTLHDVALAAGVSDATVSRALRGLDTVRPKTRQKVEEEAKRLNFTLSRSASSLASGKTMRVVILFDGPINRWFNADCLEGALETLTPAGYDLVPMSVSTRRGLADFFADLPRNGRNMDGFLLPSFSLGDEEARILSNLHIPVVALDARDVTQFPAAVVLDNRKAMHDAVQFLHRLGHRRIGYVAHPAPAPFASSSHLRKDFFLEAAGQMGYSDSDITVFGKNEATDQLPLDEAMSRIVGRIASMPDRCTGLCVEMDEIAFELIPRLEAIGIRIPEDMSLIGFDDHMSAALAGLTTIHQEPLRMARIGAQKLLTMMQGKPLDEPTTLCSTTLIVRKSTGPAPSVSGN